jgi:pimeloyl-ACP methyl ester carboxylesterase
MILSPHEIGASDNGKGVKMPDTSSYTNDGWEMHESGPSDARHTALLLPGALASHVFFEDLAAEPRLSPVRLLATTLPGYAGSAHPDDDSIETYARQAGKLAAEFGADVVVGHSVGANVAIEMAAAGEFSGPLVLLSPSFSRRDESIVPRVLDRFAAVFGHLPFTLALKMAGSMLKGRVPDDRLGALTAELRKNDPRFVRRNLHTLLSYYERYGTLVPRLCGSGLRTWVVFGENDDTKLQDEERGQLASCPQVTLVTIPETGHFTLNTHPGRIAELVLEAISAAGKTPRSSTQASDPDKKHSA